MQTLKTANPENKLHILKKKHKWPRWIHQKRCSGRQTKETSP